MRGRLKGKGPVGCAAAILAVGAAGLLAGPPGALIAGLAALLGLAALFDNHTGSLLMLAVLFVIVVAILLMLMAMMIGMAR
jgi:hypothetical protein